MRRNLTAVNVLIGANVVVFLAAFLVPRLSGPMYDHLALYYPANRQFRVWQLVTSMFMHGSIPHLFFNMFGLASFGPLLERMWGARRFLIFYFVCGLGSGVVYTAVNWIHFQITQGHLVDSGLTAAAIQAMLDSGTGLPARRTSEVGKWLFDLYSLYLTPMVGASGAIYGVLAAFGLTYPNARLSLMFVPVPIAAKYFIPGLVALDLLSGVTGISIFGGGIAHFAHIGGALIGFLLLLFWRRAERAAVSPFRM